MKNYMKPVQVSSISRPSPVIHFLQQCKPVYTFPRFVSKRFRHVTQLILLLITISLGIRFFFYVKQAMGAGPLTLSRPAGVEGFLPIGALLAWKRFIFTGQWDIIHPAAMVIFGYACFISFLLSKAFCAWICPIGTLSEWLWKTGRKFFGRSFKLPVWLDYPLRSIKYLLLAFFLWVVGVMSLPAISLFLDSPYYRLSDVKMLQFFTEMTYTTAIVLTILGVGSLLVRNFWCRYFCPYGALTGLLSMLGPTRIIRNRTTCIDCKKCTESCPHQIIIHHKSIVRSPECSACMDCVERCPVNNTLSLQSGFPGLLKKWNGWILGLTITSLLMVSIGLAYTYGHWDSQLPENEFRELLQLIDSPFLSHPKL